MLARDVLRGNRERALEELFVLVIEDDPIIQALIDEALCDGGYEPAVGRNAHSQGQHGRPETIRATDGATAAG